MQRERAYRAALARWRSYLNWKQNRNPERARLEQRFGLDTKHAAHLVRLMLQGREILEKQRLSVLLPPDQLEFVRGVREGAMSFEELEDWFDREEKMLRSAADSSPLRKKPDRQKADQLLIEVIESFESRRGR